MSTTKDDDAFSIFISYKNELDSPCTFLRGKLHDPPKVKVDVDTTTAAAGDPHWPEKILAQIRRSDLVIALLNSEACKAKAVIEELTAAWEWVIPILPIFHKEIAQEVPWFVQTADALTEFNLERKLTRGETDALGALVTRTVEAIREKNRFYKDKRAIRAAGQQIMASLRVLQTDVEGRSPAMDFRLQGIRGSTEAAADEAISQVQRKVGHRDELSVENTFLIRAKPSFSTAEKIYAVSLDRVSRFWGNGTQAKSAQEYLGSQTGKRICRLFVFSDPQSAHLLRHVLASHHRQYGSRKAGGDRGGVFVCTRHTYREQVISAFLHQIDDSNQDLEKLFEASDFGILEYTSGDLSEYYELRLTGPEFIRTFLGPTLRRHQQQVINVFEELRGLRPGEMDDTYGVLRWSDTFATSLDDWQIALERLFPKPSEPTPNRSGRVFHLVFFQRGVDYTALLDQIHTNMHRLRRSAGSSDEPLVDEVCFSMNTDTMLGKELTDGRFKGRIRIDKWFVEQYPFALFTTLRNLEALGVYYKHEQHSVARENILTAIDPTGRIRRSYELAKAAKAQRNDELMQFHYDSVEAFASTLMHRVDFQEYNDIKMLIREEPIDAGWKQYWEKKPQP